MAVEKNNVKTQQVLTGEVVSDKMDKTIVVKVTRTVSHPLLRKVRYISKKYKAHDEHEDAQVGDIVEIVVCRPLSKEKHMRLVRIVRTQES